MNERLDYHINEELESGLRYTEHMMSTGQGECRVCSVFLAGEESPVSRLKLFSFALRFGSTSVDAEGLGGVSTEQDQRRKGYLGKLIKRTLTGVRERAPVAFLFGVENLYQKFGFTACLPESKLNIWIQRLSGIDSDTDWELEPYADRHVPEIISLYNAETAMRPWSRVRAESDWPRLMYGETWRPGPECLVLTRKGEFAGYAFIAGSNYGMMPRRYEVLELAAKSDAAAKVLIRKLGKKGWEMFCQNLELREPPDGRCGIIAKHFSCEMDINFNDHGGGMGAILSRPRLVDILKGELQRRASYNNLPLKDNAIDELRDSSLVPNDAHLMRLFTGYWAWQEAQMWGAAAPEDKWKLLAAIFPGAPSTALSMPFAHKLDRY